MDAGFKLVLLGGILVGMVLERELLGFILGVLPPAGVVVAGGLLVILGSFLMRNKKNGG